eukprot:CFRG3904T1
MSKVSSKKKLKSSEKQVPSEANNVNLTLRSIVSGTPCFHVASFPQGVPPAEMFMHGESEAKFTLYRNSSNKKREVIIGDSKDVEYVGQNFGKAIAPSKTRKFAIGVVDRSTNTVSIYDAPHISMTQCPKRVKLSTTQSVSSNTTGDTNASEQNAAYYAAQATLVESYGARKNLKQLQSRQRNRLGEDAMSDVRGVVTNTLNTFDQPSQADTQTALDAGLPIPTVNEDAMSKEEIFAFDVLISSNEYESLESPSTDLMGATKLDLEKMMESPKPYYGKFILSRALSIVDGSVSDEEKRSKIARSLMYIHYLTWVFLGCRRLNDESPILTSLPVAVRDRTLASFTTPQIKDRKKVYTMSDRQKDKLVAHVFAIALHIDDFELDYADLAFDLKLNLPKAKAILKTLGCRLNAQKRTADLTWPHRLPQISMKRGRTQ